MAEVTILADHRLQGKSAGSLKSDGGGGTFDGMEARVARLEADVETIKKDVSDVKLMLARIDEKLNNFPDMNKLASEISYVKGKVEAAPTTIQLIGFAVAVFVAAGVAHYFGR